MYSIFILYSNLSMQGRFKMEYRLLTIVRYNYRDYNITLTLTPLLPRPLPTQPQTRKATDRNQKCNKKDKKGQTPPRTSLSRPSKLHFYCHFHGWVTTHGWPSGHGGYHGDPCQFVMKSRQDKTKQNKTRQDKTRQSK
jgi:hypothetical protein